jgi:hypothetical protein
MRLLIIASIALLAAACADKTATPTANVVTACIDPSGSQDVVNCVKHGWSLFSKDEGFCTCPTAAREVKATPCAPGERPPAEDAEYRETLKSASADGSLVGDTFHGKAICVAPATP